MRHLDDGQIAELIDSAGWRAGGPAGGEVDEHLRACAVCRERVEEARQIAERAKAILGTAVPVGTAGTVVPPFEEVLHRAGRGKTRRVRVGTMRWLAWAATLVIAGGLGWFARDQLATSGAASRPAESPVPPVARAELDSGTAAAAQEQIAAASRAAPAEEQKPQVTNEGKVEVPATPPAALAMGGTRARQESVTTDQIVAERSARGDQAAGAMAPPPAQNLAAPTQERLQARRAAAEAEAPVMAKTAADVADAVDERGWMPTTREEAERVLGAPVATIEGLPVVSYQVRMAGGVQVRTIQSLGLGKELELRQSPVAPGRVAAAPVPAPTVVPGLAEMRARMAPKLAGDSVVPVTDTVVIGGSRIVGRAPVSLDSLRALLKKIKE
jgi:hypothetical protein